MMCNFFNMKMTLSHYHYNAWPTVACTLGYFCCNSAYMTACLSTQVNWAVKAKILNLPPIPILSKLKYVPTSQGFVL